VADQPTVTAPEVAVPAEFAGLASAERIATAAAALQRNGISSHVTGSRAEARRLVSVAMKKSPLVARCRSPLVAG
jgi:hypothetical protein